MDIKPTHSLPHRQFDEKHGSTFEATSDFQGLPSPGNEATTLRQPSKDVDPA
jgi:hypothetical protein